MSDAACPLANKIRCTDVGCPSHPRCALAQEPSRWMGMTYVMNRHLRQQRDGSFADRCEHFKPLPSLTSQAKGDPFLVRLVRREVSHAEIPVTAPSRADAQVKAIEEVRGACSGHIWSPASVDIACETVRFMKAAS